MKTLDEYKKYYRDKYPNKSEKEITKLAQAALDLATKNASAGEGLPSFGGTQVESSGNVRGVRVGFGLTDKDGKDLYLMPGLFPSFITQLSIKNPKAYKTIVTNVYKATGKKYSDPNLLGTWLEAAGKNLVASARQDPTASTISIEALVNAGIVNRSSSGLFGGTAGNVPSRQIYAVSKDQIETDVNTVAQNILGRTITDADKVQSWYVDLVNGIDKMYKKGIVTTTELVTNPKTGKKERQTIQTPGFSKEGIQKKIEETLAVESPGDIERKKNLDFAKWAAQKMGGQG